MPIWFGFLLGQKCFFNAKSPFEIFECRLVSIRKGLLGIKKDIYILLKAAQNLRF